MIFFFWITLWCVHHSVRYYRREGTGFLLRGSPRAPCPWTESPPPLHLYFKFKFWLAIQVQLELKPPLKAPISSLSTYNLSTLSWARAPPPLACTPQARNHMRGLSQQPGPHHGTKTYNRWIFICVVNNLQPAKTGEFLLVLASRELGRACDPPRPVARSADPPNLHTILQSHISQSHMDRTVRRWFEI